VWLGSARGAATTCSAVHLPAEGETEGTRRCGVCGCFSGGSWRWVRAGGRRCALRVRVRVRVRVRACAVGGSERGRQRSWAARCSDGGGGGQARALAGANKHGRLSWESRVPCSAVQCAVCSVQRTAPSVQCAGGTAAGALRRSFCGCAWSSPTWAGRLEWVRAAAWDDSGCQRRTPASTTKLLEAKRPC
jgi:hypothetical protein